jgi:FlaG/FlaF family flagellin (archaellin)
MVHRPRNPFGVSPVIGTVILVGITIVTSSMLYFITTGLVPNPTSSAPVVVLYPASPTTVPGQYKLQLSSVSNPFPLSGFQVQVINLTTNLKISPTPISLRVSTSLIQGGGVTLGFTDLNLDGTLSGGDYFLLQGVTPGQHYMVAILWKATGNLIDSWTVPLP